MIGYDDPEYAGDAQVAAAELVGYAMTMRRSAGVPRDDIVSKLVHAQVDGGQLSSDEFGFFVILLAVAGNETTRNAISHGMLALLDHPDQWELFRAERPRPRSTRSSGGPPRSRCSSAPRSRHHAGRPGDQAGQRVGLFYRSANFDEESSTTRAV